MTIGYNIPARRRPGPPGLDQCHAGGRPYCTESESEPRTVSLSDSVSDTDSEARTVTAGLLPSPPSPPVVDP